MWTLMSCYYKTSIYICCFLEIYKTSATSRWGHAKQKNKWFTSIQYGTGEGFPTQNIKNEYDKEIEPIILKFKEGKHFLNIINNGFTDNIGTSKALHKYTELQVSDSKISMPTELVEEVSTILNQLSFEQSEFKQNGTTVFKYKKRIPVKQLFALYAINKISTIANKK